MFATLILCRADRGSRGPAGGQGDPHGSGTGELESKVADYSQFLRAVPIRPYSKLQTPKRPFRKLWPLALRRLSSAPADFGSGQQNSTITVHSVNTSAANVM
ncbi:hypothetical protein LSTR_LSTR002119 [Laodelphax striatellus]|uniref:Uncharacterized protein n=1 Tax=Laodelphax striatellus TaxID=195883 RepID=A0A482XPZ9_LAOST|nr:hypothetical protein LSTR_LSTR002119 [Laodelphax striatellus]